MNTVIHSYAGIDADGIPRVWGDGPTDAQAKAQCVWAIKEYCDSRLDIKPSEFSLFHFVGSVGATSP